MASGGAGPVPRNVTIVMELPNSVSVIVFANDGNHETVVGATEVGVVVPSIVGEAGRMVNEGLRPTAVSVTSYNCSV